MKPEAQDAEPEQIRRAAEAWAMQGRVAVPVAERIRKMRALPFGARRTSRWPVALAAGIALAMSGVAAFLIQAGKQPPVAGVPDNAAAREAAPPARRSVAGEPPAPVRAPEPKPAPVTPVTSPDVTPDPVHVEAIPRSELFLARINKLVEQVRKLYSQGEFQAAERLSVRVLQIDAANRDAAELKLMARNALQQAEIVKLKGALVKQQSSIFVERDNANNANNANQARNEKTEMENELHSYKKMLAAINRDNIIPQKAAEPAQPAKLDGGTPNLLKVIECNFENQPLPAVIDSLRNSIGIRVNLSARALEQRGEKPITLKLGQVTGAEALSKLAEEANLEIKIQDGRAILDTMTEKAQPPAPAVQDDFKKASR